MPSKINRSEFLLWRSGLMMRLVPVAALVCSLAQHSGLSTWRCCSFGLWFPPGPRCIHMPQKKKKSIAYFTDQIIITFKNPFFSSYKNSNHLFYAYLFTLNLRKQHVINLWGKCIPRNITHAI